MISKVFKSPLPSFSFFYKNGMTAVFMNGRYMTSDEAQIKELMAEVKEIGAGKSAHPYVYVDAEDMEVDSEALSPMELVRLKAREEARLELLAEQAAEQARAMSASNLSTTKSTDFASSVNNSATIAAAAESNGASIGIGTESTAATVPVLTTSKLANLTASLKK